MTSVKKIDAATLQEWLETNKPVSVVDIRAANERNEWYIPGSFHFDAYDKLKQNVPGALKELK